MLMQKSRQKIISILKKGDSKVNFEVKLTGINN